MVRTVIPTSQTPLLYPVLKFKPILTCEMWMSTPPLSFLTKTMFGAGIKRFKEI